MFKNIFVPVVGQFTNVGDAMHRRELLSWLKEVGTLHVYVGSAPKVFVDALDLPNTAKIYTNLFGWLWKLMWSPFGKTHFVFNPGEITVGVKRLLFECLLLPFEWGVKMKRGKVLRVGIAAVSNAVINYRSLWRFVLKQSDKIYWRTNDSKKMFGFGEVIPDLAFFTPKFKPGTDKRNILVVSMRGDRPEPGSNWIAAVKEFAIRKNFQIAIVSQVRMDNDRGSYLAEQFGATTYLWDDKVGHVEQEKIVREVYRKTQLVISDRLHVLIAAITDGALPSVILTRPSDKIKDHFDVVEIEGISSMSDVEKDLVDFLNNQLVREKEIYSKVRDAQYRLGIAKKEIISILS